MKIYFVGSHSTGKTELARFVSRAFKLPLISEVARAVLAEMETDLGTIRADLDRAAEYQRKVFQGQVAREADLPAFVSDRSFDNLAYAATSTCALAEIADPAVLLPYLERVRAGLVFFCRPHPDLLRADGVRAEISMESAMRVDAMVHLMLEQWSIPYFPVRGSDRQERRRLVEAVVELARAREHALEESRAMGELAVKRGRWRLVTPEEPRAGVTFLGFISRSDFPVVMVKGNTGLFFAESRQGTVPEQAPTHWQPIPPHPESA